MAALTVCQEVCAIEAEARSWQLRCYQAEAELRLLKQRRRGEAHPRWPADEEALARLHTALTDLEAESQGLEAAIRRPVRELASLKMTAARLEDHISRMADEIDCSEKSQAEAEETVKLSEVMWADESENLKTREALHVAECKSARDAVEALEASRHELNTTREAIESLTLQREELHVEKASTRLEVERLGMEIEDDVPNLLQLAESCRLASSSASRSSDISQRKGEAYQLAEREAQELADLAEECQLSEQRQLDDCRSELQEAGESSLDITEKMRRARYSHGQQLQAVRRDGAALREGLADSEAEHGERADELSEMRVVLAGIASDHEIRLDRERSERAVCESLDEEVGAAAARLFALGEAATETGRRREAVATSFAAACVSRVSAQDEHSEAAALQSQTNAESEELRAELQRMRDSFGAAATEQRNSEVARCQHLAGELNEEGARLSEQCEVLRGRAGRQQLARERQLVARRAALDAASKLKSSYGEFAKQLREGKPRGAGDSAASAGKSLKRIGSNIDDLLRFLDESAKAVEGSSQAGADDEGEEEGKVLEEVRLPQSVIDAFSGAQEQNQSGSPHSDLLVAERGKVLALQMAMREANESHKKEIARLKEQQQTFSEQRKQCELKLEEEKNRCLERRATFEAQLQEAGIRQTDVQMGAVAEIQHQLQAHSHELVRLGRERVELHAKRCHMICGGTGTGLNRSSSRSLSPDWNRGEPAEDVNSMPTHRRLKLKEMDVCELRSRVTIARTRYEDLLADAGGCQVVQDAGLVLPVVRSRKTTSSPRHPSSPAASSPRLTSRSSPKASSPFRDALIQDGASGASPDRGLSLPSQAAFAAASATRTSFRNSATWPRNPAFGTAPRRASASTAGQARPSSTTSTASSRDQPDQQYASSNGQKAISQNHEVTSIASDVVTDADAAISDQAAMIESNKEVDYRIGVSDNSSVGVRVAIDGSVSTTAGTSGGSAACRSTRDENLLAELAKAQQSAMSPDVSINICVVDSSSAIRLQSGTPAVDEFRETDGDSSASVSSMVPPHSLGAASIDAAESTPSPARSDICIPGSAVYVKSEVWKPAPVSGTALVFDEACVTIAAVPAKSRAPRRSEQSSAGPSNSSGICGASAIDFEEATSLELVDRPMSVSPGSQPTRPPSALGSPSKQRFAAGTDEADVNVSNNISHVGDKRSAESTELIALGEQSLQQMIDQNRNFLQTGVFTDFSAEKSLAVSEIVDQNSLISPASHAFPGASPSVANNAPYLWGTNTSVGHASTPGSPQLPLTQSMSSPSRSFVTSYTVNSLQSSSSQGLLVHPPNRPVPAYVPTSSHVPSPPRSPGTSPRHMTPLRVPHGGRMVWSAVANSPSPGSAPRHRSLSPGQPIASAPAVLQGPPLRSVSPAHGGPMTPWSAIAREALSPMRGSGILMDAARPECLPPGSTMATNVMPVMYAGDRGSLMVQQNPMMLGTTNSLGGFVAPSASSPRHSVTEIWANPIVGGFVSPQADMVVMPRWAPSELIAQQLRVDPRRALPAA